MTFPTREGVTFGGGSNIADLSIDYPATVNAGDLLVLIVGVRANTV